MPDRAARLKPVAKRQLLSSRDGGRALTPQSGHQRDDLTGAEVFVELYRAQFDQLVRLSRIRTGDAPEAEDLVQDAFVAVRRAYPDKSPDELRPLLFTTLRNLTLNYLKSGNTKRRQASLELLGRDDRLGCPRTATPETQLMDAQLLAIAEQTIAAMTARRRKVLKLHRFEHLTYEEIAERLSVSRSTVKKDLADAIAEVAEALARKSGRGADSRTVRK
jgi:RNA polymerase sigma factor (sigma-70 family)